MTDENPIGLTGFEFVEFATFPNNTYLEKVFGQLGCSLVATHRRKNVLLFKQSDVHFIVNKEARSYGSFFANQHGMSVVALGFRVKDARAAINEAVKRGAREFKEGDVGPMELSIPAIYGVGGSLIYFIDRKGTDAISIYDIDFAPVTQKPNATSDHGLLQVDHLTNNVYRGHMEQWVDFYQKIFGFQEIRYFDIKGQHGTGLLSRALRSPCKTFAIPINEPTDPKSQIQEYLDQYHGEGVQHIALLTGDIIKTVEALRAEGLEFLDVPDNYYDHIHERVPRVTEDMKALKRNRILVDGDEKGYLLQIFTKNLIGPIFVEIIQRKGHWGFGEGNFKALFDSIERDQRARGVI